MNRWEVIGTIAAVIATALVLARRAESPGSPRGELLFFSTVGCVPCDRMEAVLQDPAVVRALAGRPVRKKLIDPDSRRGAKLARRYSVSAYPTFILTDPKGKELRRVVGYIDPPAFARWLEGR